MKAFLFLYVLLSCDLNPGLLDPYGQAPRGVGSQGERAGRSAPERWYCLRTLKSGPRQPFPAPLPPDPTVPILKGGPGVTL